MTVTIELTPDEEQRLRERAARLGQELTAYLHRPVRQDLQAGPSAEGSFGAILAPAHGDFRASGMTEEALDALLGEALGESRAGRSRGEDAAFN